MTIKFCHFFTIILFCGLSGCLYPTQRSLFSQDHSELSSSVDSISNGQLEIYWPYVGQGDGTLLITPAGKVVMIDAGPPISGPQALLSLLAELEITKIDALVISHYDLDHLGGVPGILAGADGMIHTSDDIKIEAAYDRGGKPWDKSPGYEDYIQSLNEFKVPRITLNPGDSIEADDLIKLRCLAANGQVYFPEGIQEVDLSPISYAEQENAASIGLLILFQDFSYLTMGDLTGGGSLNGFLTPDIETLLGTTVGPVDVVHVNHHGSTSSSNLRFVERVQPRKAIIQAGVDNPYGHPNPEVVDRWQEIGAQVFSTQFGEGFYLKTDGSSAEIEFLTTP